jgi:hypothetical protein
MDRPVGDLLLFGFVMGLQKGLPSTSTARSCEEFVKTFGPLYHDPTSEAMVMRIHRMREEFFEGQRTEG